MKFEICLDAEFESEKLRKEIQKSLRTKVPPNKFGRGGIEIIESDATNYVFRRYLRGGILAGSAIHLGDLEARIKNEFEVTSRLFNAGFPTVEPVGYGLIKLPLFCKGLLVTKYLPDSKTLDLILDKKLAFELSFEVGKIAGNILEFGVMHTDLHPRNVLIQALKIKLLDFDKSKKNFVVKNAAKEILDRWLRFIKKYQLLTELGEGFRQGLTRWVK